MGTMGTVRTPRPHHTGRTMGSRSHHTGWWRSPGRSPLLSKSILKTPHSVLELSDLEREKCERRQPRGIISSYLLLSLRVLGLLVEAS